MRKALILSIILFLISVNPVLAESSPQIDINTSSSNQSVVVNPKAEVVNNGSADQSNTVVTTPTPAPVTKAVSNLAPARTVAAPIPTTVEEPVAQVQIVSEPTTTPTPVINQAPVRKGIDNPVVNFFRTVWEGLISLVKN